MTALSTLEVLSPYGGELVGEAPLAGPAEVTAALDRGAAYTNELSRHERSQILQGVGERLAREREPLAHLISREAGLCLKDTRHEVTRAIDVFNISAIEALRDPGETYPGDVTSAGP